MVLCRSENIVLNSTEKPLRPTLTFFWSILCTGTGFFIDILYLLKNRDDRWISLLKKIKHHKSICIRRKATTRCISNVAHLQKGTQITFFFMIITSWCRYYLILNAWKTHLCKNFHRIAQIFHSRINGCIWWKKSCIMQGLWK